MELILLLLDDGLDLRVLGTDDLQQILSESFRTRDLLFVWAANVPSSVIAGRCMGSGNGRDVNVHRFVSFSPCLLVHKSRANPLDLYPRLRFLLNVLDEYTLCSPVSVTYNTC